MASALWVEPYASDVKWAVVSVLNDGSGPQWWIMIMKRVITPWTDSILNRHRSTFLGWVKIRRGEFLTTALFPTHDARVTVTPEGKFPLPARSIAARSLANL
jgi:hypothetical protein